MKAKGLLQIYKQLEGDYRKCGHCIEKDKGSGDKGHGERLAVSHSLLVRSSSAIPAQDQWEHLEQGKLTSSEKDQVQEHSHR